MLITCPWCGEREEVEFRYGGAAPPAASADAAVEDDAGWGRYLYVRPNAKGRISERWVHAAGCRRWFSIVRDTVTHQISPA